MDDDHPVILFDGVCNLCIDSIQFIIRRDPDALFRFAPLQSEVATELLKGCSLDAESADSVILVEDGECYVRSDVWIRTGVLLGGRYRLAGPLRFVPRFIRDGVYDFIAARRYGWFGQRDECMMPTPELEERFLAGGPGGG